MIRYNSPQLHVIAQASDGRLADIEVASDPHSQIRIGTLSFPVRGEAEMAPVSDNTNQIADIVKKRHPALLLCAGWSVPTERNLQAIVDETKLVKTVVVLETTYTCPTPICYRLADGHPFRMGEQYFSERKDTEHGSGPRHLAGALPERSFKFFQWDALLLNCGEVMVVRGRNHVEFHRSMPQALRDAVRSPTVMILNPTHTRMGNCGTIQAWRRYLSSGGRAYVSASNWDVAKDQRQSDTLHSLWHDRAATRPAYKSKIDRLCYREWAMPLPRALRC